MLGSLSSCPHMVHISASLRTKNEFCLGEKTHLEGPHLNSTPFPKNPPSNSPVSLLGTVIADVPWAGTLRGLPAGEGLERSGTLESFRLDSSWQVSNSKVTLRR